MNPAVHCILISREFIHVLLHHQGDLQDVPALGWRTEHPNPVLQEAEAYGYKQRAGYVLKLQQQTERRD